MCAFRRLLFLTPVFFLGMLAGYVKRSPRLWWLHDEVSRAFDLGMGD